jgi:hypothetical protein
MSQIRVSFRALGDFRKKSTCARGQIRIFASSLNEGKPERRQPRKPRDLTSGKPFRKETHEIIMTSNNNKQSKSRVVALAGQLIAGTDKHLASTAQVVLAGRSYTPAQLVEKLQTLVNLRRDVDAMKASTKAKLVIEKTEMPALRALMSTLVSFVKVTFANQPDVLADFGLHSKTRTPQSAEAKTAAAAKREATRAARHIMSPKQRKRVKGAVTGITVTPVSADSSQPTSGGEAVRVVTETTPSSPTAHATSTGTTATPTTPR